MKETNIDFENFCNKFTNIENMLNDRIIKA